jgi:hypothetical protein
MSVFVLDIKNEEKGKFLLDFLRQIEFVKIEDRSAKKSVSNDKCSFKDLFGIWKGRDISVESIRKKAWKNRYNDYC